MQESAFEIHIFTQPQRFSPIFELQVKRREQVNRNEENECLLLLEHTPVFTAGKQFKPEHLLIPQDECARRGVEFVFTDRGGDITYHAPGQLVGYPIINLHKRGLTVAQYLRTIEQIIIDTLNHYDIPATRYPPYTGVWVHNRKLSAIGISIKNGISYHGFSINYDLDLTPFQWIIPCGISDKPVSSIKRELPDSFNLPDKHDFIHTLVVYFSKHLNIPSYKLRYINAHHINQNKLE